MSSDPRLDRVLRFDPRSLAHRVEAALPADAQTHTTYWNTAVTLDQGSEGACVGFGWTQWWASEASPQAATDSDAQTLYRAAQRDDEWPGEGYEGSSVLGGVRASQALGRVTSYRWATSAHEVALGVTHLGPVVIGIDWFSTMFAPDSTGLLRVPRTNDDAAGGHCTLLNGYDARRRRFRLHNSWGPTWGINGEAWLRASDLDYLLRVRKGEACLATKAAA